MRDILFRGKRVDNGEWVEGYYVRAGHHWHKYGIHEDWIVCGVLLRVLRLILRQADRGELCALRSARH